MERPVQVQRHNRARMIRLYANVATGASLSDLVRKLGAFAGEVGIAPPYALVPGGQAESGIEAARDINLSTEARRQHVAEQVEEIVRRQPETVANQVTQWMRE